MHQLHKQQLPNIYNIIEIVKNKLIFFYSEFLYFIGKLFEISIKISKGMVVPSSVYKKNSYTKLLTSCLVSITLIPDLSHSTKIFYKIKRNFIINFNYNFKQIILL